MQKQANIEASLLFHLQPSMSIVFDAGGVITCTKAVLDFFLCEDIDSFQKESPRFFDRIIESSPLLAEEDWLECIYGLHQEKKQKITLFDKSKKVNRIFAVGIARAETEKNLYVVSLFDVTEYERQNSALEIFSSTLKNEIRKEIEERIWLKSEKNIQEQMLLQKSKLASMGEMIGVVAHQWKQPLNSIFLISQTLPELHHNGSLDFEALQESTKEIIAQVQFMSETIDNFRDFFKPEKEEKLFDIALETRRIIKILSPQMLKASIELVFDVDRHQIYEIEGYSNEIKQVILNIINNAKDAINMYKVKIGDNRFFGKIFVALEGDTETIRMRISDNGGGLSIEALQNLFQPYFSTKEENGTGIGLYLAKTIICNHFQGDIQAYNDGFGAVFEITIPRRKTQGE